MGDRRQVCITFPDGGKIYLYTHHCGQNLPMVVANALEIGRERWSDPPYLARIIFSCMVENNPYGTSGYGMSTEFQESDYGAKDIYLRLSFGDSGRVGIGSAYMKYDEFIREYKEEE